MNRCPVFTLLMPQSLPDCQVTHPGREAMYKSARSDVLDSKTLPCSAKRSLILALLVAIPAQAQERVQILADSAGWVFTHRVFGKPLDPVCEIATRVQPGAMLAFHRSGLLAFVVSLQPAPHGQELDSLYLRLDDHPPLIRIPAKDERRQNAVIIRNDATAPILASKRLRLRAVYRGSNASLTRGGYEDLDIDLKGLHGLQLRIWERRCFLTLFNLVPVVAYRAVRG